MFKISHCVFLSVFCSAAFFAALFQSHDLFAQDSLISPTQSAAESAARQQNAEDSFRGIIAPQNMDFDNAIRSKMANPGFKGAYPAPAQHEEPSYAPPAASSDTGGTASPEAAVERQVVLSLEDYQLYQDKLRAAREQNILLEGPAVILGASEYTGKAVPGALALNLKLKVILGAGNKWKTVPLVGEDVVLVGARVSNKPIPTARQNGYLVWTTKQTGEMLIDIDILVPSRGPKGSIEYDFFAPKTPVTKFSCFFPVTGLEPRLADARQSQAVAQDGGTFFEAVLKPTSRIHFVGYKDIKSDEETPAGLFTESMNLVSIDEGVIDLFSVFRYTILYAGAKDFHIEIPKDMTVVSAEGESAFSFALEEAGDKTILRGETAFPIRNNFEISLRLKRRIMKPEQGFEVPLPHAINAEREHGWIAVEVPGKLQIEEKNKQEVTTLDVRQLPEEMVRSAVSPIVKAYRFHNTKASVVLSAKKLPEKEPESGSIDRIRAFSVISKDGKMLTDMRIRMRNRLRSTLALKIQKSQKLLSAHLDGEAVRPSREGKDTVILPLKRSEGDDSMEPFALQVVMESTVREMGLFGAETIRLPSVDLPVSSVEWTVYMPASNTYSALKGDVDTQVLRGEAAWYSSPFSGAPVRTFIPQGDTASDNAGLAAEGTGVVAVRIDLPKTGMRLDYAGYWVDADKPVSVYFYYARSRLLIPLSIALVLLFAAGGMFLVTGLAGRSSLRAASGLVALAAAYLLYKTAGSLGIAAAILLAVGAGIYRRRVFPRLKSWTVEWAATFVARFKERDKEETKLKVTRVLVGLCMGIVGFFLLGAFAGFIHLLFSPL